MNLPNKLTLSRVIMVPFFVAFLLLAPKFSSFKWIALAIFIVASLTDLLDGKIARKYNLITNFGKFMDPLADKLLVCSALIGLSSLDVVPAWITIIIIAREFIISGFRLIAAEKGIADLAAGTAVYQVYEGLTIFANVTMYIALALTIVSLIDYLMKNKDVLKDVD